MQIADPVTHRTEWRLEKRDGSVEDFIADRRAEAREVIGGHRPSGQIDEGGLRGEVDVIQRWLRDPATPEPVRGLWTPDRVIDAALQRLFEKGVDPFEVVERAGNLMVTAGITVLLHLLTGGADTVFSNATAYLGVGDSTTAVSVGQTDLQAGSNKLRKAMNATYPIVAAPSVQFQATFGSGEANFAWSEIATFNGPSGSSMLNRVVQSLGTKSSGATWSATEAIAWA